MAKDGAESNRVVAILIEDQEEFLLMGVRNDNKKWANPGGHLKVGECFYMGTIRELKEETGLDAKEIRVIKIVKVGAILVYLMGVKVDLSQEIDPSNDPDKECDMWSFIDPNQIIDELHVPANINVVIKHWVEN